MFRSKRTINSDVQFIKKQLVDAMLHKDGVEYISAIILLERIEKRLNKCRE